jgi:hypothetical protein
MPTLEQMMAEWRAAYPDFKDPFDAILKSGGNTTPPNRNSGTHTPELSPRSED